MTSHDSWALVCRLFSGGTPVFRSALAPHERATCDSIGVAIKPTVVSQSSILCPYCRQHSGPLLSGGDAGRVCHCPECGVINVTADDLAAIALHEPWLQKNLRLALEIESRDGVVELSNGIWRLGNMRRDPVLLARSVTRLATQPSILDRARVAGGEIVVIAPKERGLREAPFPRGVTWLPLEERFTFYGGRIAFCAPESRAVDLIDPTKPVQGPFSKDFQFVTLSTWRHGIIDLTPAQTAVMSALWKLNGKPAPGSEIMRRAGQRSKNPIDVFKTKGANKGDPKYEGRLYAFHTLVKSKKRDGLYWITPPIS